MLHAYVFKLTCI